MGLDSGKMVQDFPMRGLVKCIWGFPAFNGIGFVREEEKTCMFESILAVNMMTLSHAR